MAKRNVMTAIPEDAEVREFFSSAMNAFKRKGRRGVTKAIKERPGPYIMSIAHIAVLSDEEHEEFMDWLNGLAE